jgi:hypothetical protein
MIIGVEGTKNFNNYQVFLHAMGVALSNPIEGSKIEVWSAGPKNINSFTAAFCNSSENYLRQKGYKISFKRFPQSHVLNNMHEINYFAFFANPNEKSATSKLLASAEMSEAEVGIFRY